mmetsp:Transcript_10251/g.16008  ORF Transcript_10251/g.16008 Transcript_10251/m.16008 type:complete len:190 (-) Transcript_10251:268-837(-)
MASLGGEPKKLIEHQKLKAGDLDLTEPLRWLENAVLAPIVSIRDGKAAARRPNPPAHSDSLSNWTSCSAPDEVSTGKDFKSSAAASTTSNRSLASTRVADDREGLDCKEELPSTEHSPASSTKKSITSTVIGGVLLPFTVPYRVATAAVRLPGQVVQQLNTYVGKPVYNKVTQTRSNAISCASNLTLFD